MRAVITRTARPAGRAQRASDAQPCRTIVPWCPAAGRTGGPARRWPNRPRRRRSGKILRRPAAPASNLAPSTIACRRPPCADSGNPRRDGPADRVRRVGTGAGNRRRPALRRRSSNCAGRWARADRPSRATCCARSASGPREEPDLCRDGTLQARTAAWSGISISSTSTTPAGSRTRSFPHDVFYAGPGMKIAGWPDRAAGLLRRRTCAIAIAARGRGSRVTAAAAHARAAWRDPRVNPTRRAVLDCRAGSLVLLLGRAEIAWSASIIVAVRVWPADEYRGDHHPGPTPLGPATSSPTTRIAPGRRHRRPGLSRCADRQQECTAIFIAGVRCRPEPTARGAPGRPYETSRAPPLACSRFDAGGLAPLVERSGRARYAATTTLPPACLPACL